MEGSNPFDFPVIRLLPTDIQILIRRIEVNSLFSSYLEIKLSSESLPNFIRNEEIPFTLLESERLFSERLFEKTHPSKKLFVRSILDGKLKTAQIVLKHCDV
jgi:hypothetical protein